MSRRQGKWLCLLLEVWILCYLAMVFPGLHTFTPERWANTPSQERYKYIWSLERKYKLQGMTRQEVESLLGPSDLFDNGEEYRIDDNVIASHVYHIDYEDDKVVKAGVMVEDW